MLGTDGHDAAAEVVQSAGGDPAVRSSSRFSQSSRRSVDGPVVARQARQYEISRVRGAIECVTSASGGSRRAGRGGSRLPRGARAAMLPGVSGLAGRDQASRHRPSIRATTTLHAYLRAVEGNSSGAGAAGLEGGGNRLYEPTDTVWAVAGLGTDAAAATASSRRTAAGGWLMATLKQAIERALADAAKAPTRKRKSCQTCAMIPGITWTLREAKSGCVRIYSTSGCGSAGADKNQGRATCRPVRVMPPRPWLPAGAGHSDRSAAPQPCWRRLCD